MTIDNTPRALVAISMGDPAGIGPETIVRAAASGFGGPCVVLGDVGVLRRAAGQCALQLPVTQLESAPAAMAASKWPCAPPVHHATRCTRLPSPGSTSGARPKV